MSYADTKCPCGGKKPRDTMFCDDCEQALAARREMVDMNDVALPLSCRRQAAFILLALARGRASKQ